MSLRIVVFDRVVHATQDETSWRALCRALGAWGHDVVTYEDLDAMRTRGPSDLAHADAAIVTSTSTDAAAATELVLASRVPTKVFYDLDPADTLVRLRAGERVPYVGVNGYADFDLVLSASGGPALSALERDLGAKCARTLYGCVDPDVHFPVHVPVWACDFSYLGAFSADRQVSVDELFVDVARLRPDKRFLLAGAGYPDTVNLPTNVLHVDRVATDDQAAFYGSANFTLDVTGAAAQALGFCPSARLFEAAATGTPVVMNGWQGIESFFEPESEIIVVRSTEDVLRTLTASPSERARIAAAARRRVLAHHTSTTRARELVAHLTAAAAVDSRPNVGAPRSPDMIWGGAPR